MAGMTLDLAEECVRRIKEKAREMKIEMFIAVVDEMGKLVAYARMGEAGGGFGEKIAIAKAKTAVAYKRDTKQTMERYANYPGNYLIAGMSGLYPDEFWAGPRRRADFDRRQARRRRRRFRLHAGERSQVRHRGGRGHRRQINSLS